MTPTQIKESRIKFGITQKQLSKVIGCTERTVQNWEAGGKLSKVKCAFLEWYFERLEAENGT